jgi:hypothetical protein
MDFAQTIFSSLANPQTMFSVTGRLGLAGSVYVALPSPFEGRWTNR